MRYKLVSAASALAMAMAIGDARAAELLTDNQLDTVTAGRTILIGVSLANGPGAVVFNNIASCVGPCGLALTFP